MPKLTSPYKLNEEQLKQLKQIVPEAFKDNILDFNNLYEALSDFLEDDENTDLEQFGLSWPGKRQAKRAAAIPPVGTLVPVPGDGVDEETTKNIYIEGDNLEVLKILKKAYTGRIKMIYIDPPYNTGNDFIYPDDFSESVESFQRRTGQLNENNEKMTTNNRSDGRFHSKWLSMMYPRLYTIRELLAYNGVLIISISDDEVDNLIKVCNEIFGENNYCGNIIWNSTKSVTNTALISVSHTYNLIYFKDINYFIENRNEFRLPDDGSGFENLDNDPRGPWKADPFQVGGWRPNQQYIIKNPKTGLEYKPNPGCSWKNDYNKYLELIKDNRIVFGKTGESGPQRKRFIWEAQERGKVAKTLWDDIETTTNGTQLLKNMFNDNSIFDNPKPVELIYRFLQLASDKNSIILDFFSGSSTSAHAVMQLNAEDNGNRKFIMVQLPELCKEDGEAAKAGFKNICEIGKERIRRAGKKIKEEAGLNTVNLDTGFKVFRLAPSNYKAWENYTGTDVKQLEELFKADSLMQDWKEDDLLTEIMLLEGFPLDSKIEILSQFKKNKIKKISSDFRDNALYICLDKDIAKETIEILHLTDKERFICLDSAIDDQSKIRLEDKNLIKTL